MKLKASGCWQGILTICTSFKHQDFPLANDTAHRSQTTSRNDCLQLRSVHNQIWDNELISGVNLAQVSHDYTFDLGWELQHHSMLLFSFGVHTVSDACQRLQENEQPRKRVKITLREGDREKGRGREGRERGRSPRRYITTSVKFAPSRFAPRNLACCRSLPSKLQFCK